MKFSPVIVLFVAALVALPLSAKEKSDPAVNANSKDAFETVSTWVRKQMDEGGRYSYVTSSERTRVDTKLGEMGTLFQARGDVAQMSDVEKTRMFNDQEEVNAILAKRDNERLICKTENPTGSHIPVKTCRTAGEIEARRRGDEQYLQWHQRTPQLKAGG
jgi:hypothetical protein